MRNRSPHILILGAVILLLFLGPAGVVWGQFEEEGAGADSLAADSLRADSLSADSLAADIR